jgi:predicted ATPase
MRRYILTGTPGSGKTAIIRALESEGHPVVEEAATDVIALANARGDTEAWRSPAFIDAILALQLRRLELAAKLAGEIQFHDRSPVCTHALCVHLGYIVPRSLSAAIARLLDEHIYERKVFFIENLGFVEPTEARKITFEDSLAFERVHEESYRRFGFELARIPAKELASRVVDVVREVGSVP